MYFYTFRDFNFLYIHIHIQIVKFNRDDCLFLVQCCLEFCTSLFPIFFFSKFYFYCHERKNQKYLLVYNYCKVLYSILHKTHLGISIREVDSYGWGRLAVRVALPHSFRQLISLVRQGVPRDSGAPTW